VGVTNLRLPTADLYKKTPGETLNLLLRRRMILPLRIFGSVSVKRMSSGLARAPISLRR